MTDDGSAGDVSESRTSRSWFARIGDSLRAIVFGLVLFIVAIVLLAWNEGRAVTTARALEEGAATVASVSADALQAANEGRLVHIAGMARATGPARDPDLGVSADGLKLQRQVEMFQWKEERRTETVKKLGGGEETVTRYTYSRDWSDKAIDSSRFNTPGGHANPPMPALASRAFHAPEPRIGAFSLGRGVIDGLTADASAGAPDPASVRQALGARARVQAGGVYVGDPATPRVGDVRVTLRAVPEQELSVIGRQTGAAITPYRASNGREILLSAPGVRSADAMFQQSLEENTLITWLVRLGGMILMFAAVRMALSLLEVLADVIPLLGSVVGAGASLVALTVTLAVAPVVIALAWIAYRPLVAVGVLAAGAAGVFVAMRVGKGRRVAASAAG